jgi:hypothetical protein
MAAKGAGVTRTDPQRRPQPAGGIKRTAAIAASGVLLLIVAAGCLALTLLVRPSTRSGTVARIPVTVDPNNLGASKAETTLDARGGAQYDFYLTVREADRTDGDYASLDIEAHRDTTSRYLTYGYIYFGDEQYRRGGTGLGAHREEIYEIARNISISNQDETIRILVTPSSAWFAGMKPIRMVVDVVEVTAIDRLLLVATNVTQVTVFPASFLALALLWLAIMRQLRLIGVPLSPPGKFRLRRPLPEGDGS